MVEVSGQREGAWVGLLTTASMFITVICSTTGNATNPSVPITARDKHLRRVSDKLPKPLLLVGLVALLERFTFWGMTAPWQNYMQNNRENHGVLGLGQSLSSSIYCAFYTFYYVTPLIFGFISDTRLGRYKTLCLCTVLYSIGCAILCISSHPTLSNKWGVPGLVTSLVLLGLGGGGFKAIIAPFIVDQYTNTTPTVDTLKNGERVVTDRAVTIQYIYNLYFWVCNVGALSWFATTSLERFGSFTAAYGLASGSMFLSTLLLFAGGKWLVKLPCEGNVLPMAAKALACASRNRFKMQRADPDYQLQHHGKTVSWSHELVVELTRGLKACRVFIGFITFYVCFDQMQNNFISQAGQMESHGVPNDVVAGLNQIACIILGPLTLWLYTFLAKKKIAFRPIARITVGFIMTTAAMVYATVVQQLIYTTGPCYTHATACYDAAGNHTTNHINIWIQAPIYILIAAGEIFALVTGLEYAYDNSPEEMRVIVQAFSLLVAGVASAIATAITPAAKDPYLVALYACLATVMGLTTAIFWLLCRQYDRTDQAISGDDIELDEAGMPDDSRGQGQATAFTGTSAKGSAHDSMQPGAA